jgi:hypothetical protein
MEENRPPVKLLSVLILSLTFNVVFLATQVLKAWEKKELLTTIQLLDPIIDSRKERGVGGEMLKKFFNMPYELLIEELHNSTHIESGLKRQDLALAVLAQFHYFPIDKVVPQAELERRLVYFENHTGEKIALQVFVGLKDQRFLEAINYLLTQAWPMTTEGLIHELKRMGNKAPDSLKRAFFATQEFQRIWKVFEASGVVMEPENILSVLLLSDDLELNSVQSLKALLKPLLERRSKSVVSLYFWIEPDLFSLTDSEVLEILELAPVHLEWVQEGVKKILESTRSDLIKDRAQKCLEGRIATQSCMQELPAKPIKHKVESRETLWLIAKKYRVSVEEIASLNNISPTQVLSVGKELEIPASSTTSIPPG